MADYQLYVDGVYLPAEGSNYTPNDIAPGIGSKFGVSAELYYDATGKSISEAQLQAASWEQLEAAVKWVWFTKFKGDKIKSQMVAEVLIDHALNKGWVLMGYNLQYLLNDIYGCSLTEDGAVGSLTIAALNATTDKFGEDDLYCQIRGYRRRFYLGEGMFYDPSRPFSDGYKDTRMGGVLVASRLDRFFPWCDENANPPGYDYADTGEEVTREVTQTDIYKQAAKDTLFNPKRFTDWVALAAILAALYFLGKNLFKTLAARRRSPKMA